MSGLLYCFTGNHLNNNQRKETKAMRSSIPLPYQIAYSTLWILSRDLLERDGHVALGDLFTSMRLGEGNYEGVPREVTVAVAGLAPVEIQGIYEMVLFRLERERGPLECEDPKEDTLKWGYAMPRDVACPKPTLADMPAAMQRRMDAFDDGHPDRFRDLEAGTLPTTIWSVAKSKRPAHLSTER